MTNTTGILFSWEKSNSNKNKVCTVTKVFYSTSLLLLFSLITNSSMHLWPLRWSLQTDNECWPDPDWDIVWTSWFWQKLLCRETNLQIKKNNFFKKDKILPEISALNLLRNWVFCILHQGHSVAWRLLGTHFHHFHNNHKLGPNCHHGSLAVIVLLDLQFGLNSYVWGSTGVFNVQLTLENNYILN